MAPSLHWFLLLCPGLPISSLQSDNEICILGKGGSQWGSSNPAPDSELGVRALCLEGGGREKYLGHHVWSSNISRIQDYFFFFSIPALQVEGVDWTVSYIQEELSFPELESSHISVYLLRYTPHRLCVWAPRTNQTPKSAPLQPDTVG